MRPRDFLLKLFTITSEELRCREILGISDKGHFSQQGHKFGAKFNVH